MKEFPDTRRFPDLLTMPANANEAEPLPKQQLLGTDSHISNLKKYVLAFTVKVQYSINEINKYTK